MNEYRKEQAGLTHDEKRAFVDKAKADEAGFLRSLRKITDRADSRMMTRVARERSGGTDEDDADDASVKPAS